jgi:hypothetical protein
MTLIFGLANSGSHPVTSNAGYSGAPGDLSCATCHSTSNNLLDGSVTMTGLPSTILTKEKYTIRIKITNPNGIAEKAGFQLVVLTGTNTNAGIFSNNSVGTEIKTVSGGRSYFGHAPAKTFPVENEMIFTVDWQAPNTTGSNPTIKFYVTAVIANGNGSETGDRVVLFFADIPIKNPNPLTLTINNIKDVKCSGSADGSATAVASGGSGMYNYVWSNGLKMAKNDSLKAGIQSVTVTDSFGDTLSANVSIGSPPAINLVTFGSRVCKSAQNGYASVIATGGTGNLQFRWSSGETSASITGIGAGKYYVTVSDNNACLKNDTIEVTSSPDMIINNLVYNPSCFGKGNGLIDIQVTGGTPPYKYLWSNQQTSSSIKNLKSGTYVVTVTDSIFCTATKSVFLSQPDSLKVAITSLKNVTCYGGTDGSVSINASGGNSNYTYYWPNGTIQNGATGNINNLSSGTYTVTITDLNDCSVMSAITISQPTLIKTNGIVKDISCFGSNDGSISLQPSGVTGTPKYKWSNDATSQSIQKLMLGKYFVTVTDSLHGCLIVDSFSIKQPLPMLVQNINKTDNRCFGDSSGTAQLTLSGGTLPYAYKWSNRDTTSSLSGLKAGNYFCTITDKNNCTIRDSVKITQPKPILIIKDTSSNVSCKEVADGFIGISLKDGIGRYKVNWSNGKDTTFIAGLSSGIYKVSVSDTNQCLVQDSVTIGVKPPFDFTLPVLKHVRCFEDSTGEASVIDPNNYTYKWSNGSSGNVIGKLPAGDYSVTAINSAGCKSNPHSFTITQPMSIQSSITNADTLLCPGDRNNAFIQIKLTGGTDTLSYVWSNNKKSLNLDSLAAGDYRISVTDKNLCTTIFNYKVIVTDTIQIADKKVKDVSCFGSKNGSVSLSVKGGYGNLSYQWGNSNANEGELDSLSQGIYRVTISDGAGCKVVDSTLIKMPDSILVQITKKDETIAGRKDGSIKMVINGGTPPYTVKWDHGVTGPSIDPAAPGRYIYAIQDANGCERKGDVVIGGGLCALSATFSTSPSTCVDSPDGRIIMDIKGQYSKYKVDIFKDGQSINASLDSLSSGKYFLIITDSLQCQALIPEAEVKSKYAPIVVQQIIKTNPTTSSAKNGSMEAEANGGKGPYTYEWFKDGIKVGSSKKIENIAVGIYSLIVKDSVGCSLKMNNIFLLVASATEEALQASIQIYPNPISETLNIANYSDFSIDGIEMYNLTGQKIFIDYKKRSDAIITINDVRSMSGSSGIFILKLKIDGKFITRKVVIY